MIAKTAFGLGSMAWIAANALDKMIFRMSACAIVVFATGAQV